MRNAAGEYDLLAVLMEQAVIQLKRTHAELLEALPEVQAVFAGHLLTYVGRKQLLRHLEDWGMERGWFTRDDWGAVTLAQVCDAADSDPAIVREFYAEWLRIPFDPEWLYRRLRSLRDVRNKCRKCARARGEAARRDRAEGGTPGEGVAGSTGPVEWEGCVRRTQATGGRTSHAAARDRKNAPTPGLQRLLSDLDRRSGGVAA